MKTTSYKAAFFALIGIFLMCGICKCSAQIQPDKKMHLAGGAAIGAWSTRLTIEQDGWKPAVLGISIPLGVGLAKEGFDLAGGGTAEWADVRYTVVGAVISVAVIYGIKAIVKRHEKRGHL